MDREHFHRTVGEEHIVTAVSEHTSPQGGVRRPPGLFCPSERTEIAADRPLIGDPETFALVIRPITGG